MAHVHPDGGVKKEFGALMYQLAEAWGTRLSETRVRVYAQALGDIAMADLGRACDAAARSCRYFPSVHELRAFAGVVDGEDAWLIAWVAFMRAASAAGAYSNVVVDDGAAAEALELVFGSWAEFCEMEDGPQLSQRRQEFFAAYRAARVRGSSGPRRLIGLLPPPPDEVAPHIWVAHIAGSAVTVERDRPRLGEGTTRAALPEARTEE